MLGPSISHPVNIIPNLRLSEKGKLEALRNSLTREGNEIRSPVFEIGTLDLPPNCAENGANDPIMHNRLF